MVARKERTPKSVVRRKEEVSILLCLLPLIARSPSLISRYRQRIILLYLPMYHTRPRCSLSMAQAPPATKLPCDGGIDAHPTSYCQEASSWSTYVPREPLLSTCSTSDGSRVALCHVHPQGGASVDDFHHPIRTWHPTRISLRQLR